MTDRRARIPPTPAAGRSDASPSAHVRQRSRDDVARYAPIGRQCAFANARLLGRVLAGIYDEALRPVELRASQLALLWAIAACEPVGIGALSEITATDQTTLSRTVDKLCAAGLVAVRAGKDRRVKVLRLTAQGRRRFVQAMPYWERVQRDVAACLPLEELETLARRARNLLRKGP